MGTSFLLGSLEVWPRAALALAEVNLNTWSLVYRHAAGDWGEVRVSDLDQNRLALEIGSEILSAYTLGTGARVLVVTGGDRTRTTVLLAREWQPFRAMEARVAQSLATSPVEGSRESRGTRARDMSAPAPTGSYGRTRVPGEQKGPRLESTASWTRYVDLRPNQSARTGLYRVRQHLASRGLPADHPYAEDEAWLRRGATTSGAAAAPDYYGLLGVDPAASEEQVERAYRQCVSRIHPDKYFNDAERQTLAQAKLKQLNAAIRVLRDPEQRARYDLAVGVAASSMPLTARLKAAAS